MGGTQNSLGRRNRRNFLSGLGAGGDRSRNYQVSGGKGDRRVLKDYRNVEGHAFQGQVKIGHKESTRESRRTPT